MNNDERNFLIDNFNPDNTTSKSKLKSKAQFERALGRKLKESDYQNILETYNKDWNARVRMNKKKKTQELENLIQIDPNMTLQNPFRSAYKNPNPPQKIPDLQIKPRVKKFGRPYFSQIPHSYEIDHLQYQNQTSYLIFININTRFLLAIPVPSKEAKYVIQTIQTLINPPYLLPINFIRGDGDKGFRGQLANFLEKNNIRYYFPESPFTNKNRIVDSAIKTLRNALGPNTNHLWNGKHDNIIQQLITYYNNTIHKSLKHYTPAEVQKNIDLEKEYIKRQEKKLNKILENQLTQGLQLLKPGDLVMLYLQKGKTGQKFDKKRRTFEYIATFLQYNHGNAIIKINNQTIEVPLYWIEKIKTSDLTKITSTFNYKL